MANSTSTRNRRAREAERIQAQHDARDEAMRRAVRRRRRIGVGVVVVVVLATVGGIFAATRPKSTTTAAGSTSTTKASVPPSSGPTASVNPNPPVSLPLVAPGASITGETPCPNADGSSPRTTSFEQAPPMCIDPATKDYEAVIRTSKGDIKMFLTPDVAPNTVNNFVTLARYHYYDGLPVTRIIPRGWAEVDDITDAGGNRGPGYALPNESNPQGTVTSPNTVAMIPDPGDGTTGGGFLFGLADQYIGMPQNVVMIGLVSDNRLDQSPSGALDKTVAQEVDKAATESHRPAEVITIHGVDIVEKDKAA